MKHLWILVILLLGVLPVMGQTPSPQDILNTITFTEWVDPNEQAFTMQIPVGWVVDGGMQDIRGQKFIYYSILSPEQDALVMVGQSRLTISLQPNNNLTQQGYTEGTILVDEGNYVVRVASYQTGVEAAKTLIQNGFQELCTVLLITEEHDVADRSGLNDAQNAFISVGEVAFTCTIQNFTFVGYFQATTYATVDTYYGESWTIRDTYGFLAERSKVDQAVAVLANSLGTIEFSETWVMEQQRLQQQLAMQYQQAQQSGTAQSDDWAYYAYLSQMSAMQHQISMAIIHNIGGGYDVEWEYDYSYDW